MQAPTVKPAKAILHAHCYMLQISLGVFTVSFLYKEKPFLPTE